MGGAALVGDEVEAGAAALALVKHGVGKRDEGELDGGDVVSAEGAEENPFAAREGDDGGRGVGGKRGGGGAVGEGDETTGVGIACR